MSSLEAAMAARDKLVDTLGRRAGVASIGVIQSGDEYGLRVRTVDDADVALPDDVDGVPVTTRRSGAPRAHGASRLD